MFKANRFLQYWHSLFLLLCSLRNNFIKISKTQLLSFLFWLTVFIVSIPSILHAHDNINVHPYIAEQALFVWPKDVNTNPLAYPEIYQYLGYGYRDSSTGDVACNSAHDGGFITEGAKEEDDYDPIAYTCIYDWMDFRPNVGDYYIGYLHHFYEPDWPAPYNGLFINDEIAYGALAYAHFYWEEIKKNYPSNKQLAYWYLGRVAHLIQDAAVPAHVHNDAHGSCIVGHDSYEDFMKSDSNYRLWGYVNAEQLAQNSNTQIPETWGLDELFWNLAQRAQYFPSDDYDGDTIHNNIIVTPELPWFTDPSGTPWPNTTGWRKYGINECVLGDYYIENNNLLLIGDKLMPLAIQYTSALYRYFWVEVSPVVTAFQVTPESLTQGNKVTVSYTVSDNLDSGIKQVELWRTNDINCASGWTQIGLPITDGLTSGNFSDAPSSTGTYCYGIHVCNNAGNCNDEKNSNTDGIPGVYGPIKVTVKKINVTSPNGGENWQAETTQTIKWSYGGGAGSYIKIELLKGNTATVIKSYAPIGTNGQGSYAWTVPTTQTLGNDYRIRVTSTSNSTYTDTSDGTFTITAPPPPSITVTSPNGGESWTAGTTYQIKWTYTGNPGTYVKIELLKGGSVNRTITSYASKGSNGSGSYNWKIPSTQAPGTDYKIRVTSTSNSSVTDTSNADFTIKGLITVNSPNGGETWQVGTTQTIRWAYTGNPGSYVKIELLKGGVLNRTITASTSIGSGGSGSYNWLIPLTQTLGTDYKVRITSTTNSTYTDTSDANFAIFATYSISGQVRTSEGTGISEVTMTLSGAATATTTTDSDGNYNFSGLSNGTYTITPIKANYTFTPEDRIATVNNSDVTGQDFTATLTISGGTIQLPQTGQTKCYDTAGTEIACAGTGQDGEIQAGVAWPNPRFTTNVDTTVTDNLTGLVWAPNGNIMPIRDPGWDADGTANDGAVTWQHALDYVAKLNAENYLGHADWRLPNVNELESLINADEPDTPTWLNTQGFINVQSGYYWSSTSYACNLSDVLIVTIWGNSGGAGLKYYDNFPYVWPVRAGPSGNSDSAYPANIWKTGQTTSYATGDDGDLNRGVTWPSPRFTDNGDGSVTDNLTGLIWLRDANCMKTNYSSFDNDYIAGDGRVSWQHALDFIKGINNGTCSNCGGVHNDWRLPNRKELHSLIDYSQCNPALPSGHPFTNVQSDYPWESQYWSSTSAFYSYKENAWLVDMLTGFIIDMYKDYYSGFYVWPVRGGLVNTYSISGTVFWCDSPSPGETVTLSGAANGTTTTDSNGKYSFSELTNGTYTVTAIGYGSETITVNGVDVTDVDFEMCVWPCEPPACPEQFQCFLVAKILVL